ncbi:NAD(P)/FAD-dependent oxidoreductase [Halapricum desulfuricans]
MSTMNNRQESGRSYVIIGDGIAGSSAAEILAEETDSASITILSAESEPLYNRILIKEYAKGKLPRDVVEIHDQSWYDERGIDLRLDTRVQTVETDEKTVVTADGERIAYDELIVATGGTPRQLPVPNGSADGVTTFWTVEDAARIREQASEAETGAIVGGGLLGIDYAAVAAAQDVEAHYLIREDRWFARAMSPAGAAIVHDALRERGVEPVFETTVQRFETDPEGRVAATVTEDGRTYDSDFVGVAIGTEPNTAFLEDTPVTLDGGVVVDSHLRTGVESVWAAGDVTRYYDERFSTHLSNGTWESAATQGELAARNALADDGGDPFETVPSYTVNHFPFPIASFGHPSLGDAYVERTYGEREWRRLAFRDGMLVGGVLIGDLAPLKPLKELTASGARVQHRAPALLAQSFDGLTVEQAPTPVSSD